MKIIAITGCRSEFDIISNVIESLIKRKHDVKLIISGSHLSDWHGKTFKEIKKKKI